MTAPFRRARFTHVHIDNLVDAIVRAVESDATGRAYNVADGAAPTHEYIDALARAVGRPLPEPTDEAPVVTFPTDRIRAELGWEPRDRFSEFLGELEAAGVASAQR